MCTHRTEHDPWASSTSCSPTRRSRPSPPRPTPCPAAPSRCRSPDRHTVLGTPLAGPLPAGAQRGRLRPRLLLGRREDVLADAGRDLDRRRLRRRLHAEPDLPGGLLGRTGHAEVVRVVFDPARVSYARPAPRLLGAPRPDAGHAPGQRPGHAVPVGHPRLRRGAAGGRRGVTRRLPGGPREGRLRRRSRPRSSTRRRSTTPRTTTSSTSTRTRTATAPTTGRASRCPIGLGRHRRRVDSHRGARGVLRWSSARPEAFFRVRSVLGRLGPVDVRTTQSQVAFRRARGSPTSGCPAGTSPSRRQRSVLSFALGRRRPSPRLKEVAASITEALGCITLEINDPDRRRRRGRRAGFGGGGTLRLRGRCQQSYRRAQDFVVMPVRERELPSHLGSATSPRPHPTNSSRCLSIFSPPCVPRSTRPSPWSSARLAHVHEEVHRRHRARTPLSSRPLSPGRRRGAARRGVARRSAPCTPRSRGRLAHPVVERRLTRIDPSESRNAPLRSALRAPP